MGRFYTTAERDYQDDFIFQPDWQLAKESLLKQDADVASQINTYDLLDNLDIKTWQDADGENAKNVQEKYSTKVDDLAKKLSTNLLDRNNKMALRSLQTELLQDRKSGDISKIEQNATAYENYQAELAKRKNPADKQRYARMVSDYMNESEGKGALGKIFTPDPMFDDRNVGEEFASSDIFKGMKADGVDTNVKRINGELYVTEGNKTVELKKSKLGQGMLAWMEGEGLKPYATDRQKYADQNWLDASGEISFAPGTMAGNALEGISSALAYKTTATNSEQEYTPDAINARAYYRQKRDEEAQDFIAVDGDVDASQAFGAERAAIDYEKDAVKSYIDTYYYGALGVPVGTELDAEQRERKAFLMKEYGTIDKLKKYLEKTKKSFVENSRSEKFYTTSINKLNRVEREIKSNLRASYAPLRAMGIDDGKIESFKEEHNKYFNTYGESLINYTLLPTKYSDNTGKAKQTIVKNNHNNTGKTSPAYKTGGFSGQRIVDGGGVHRDIISTKIMPDSSIPVFLNRDPNNLKNNYAIAVLEFSYYKDPKLKGDALNSPDNIGVFERQVSYDMKNNSAQ